MLDAWGWCTGMTQRDGMGREEEGRDDEGQGTAAHGAHQGDDQVQAGDEDG